MFWTVVLQLLIGVLAGLAFADTPGKPALTVILERNEILAGQTMSFSVWIENATDAKIINAALSLFGPSFLKIGTLDQKGTCSTKDTIDLDNVDPGSTLVRNKLCLQAGSSIQERDENLGFGVSYSLEKDKKATAGALVSEKKVSIGLFGTESVGGVSLRLAAYLIPGTFFLMILRLFGPKEWTVELGATESVTLSIFISVFLFFLAAFGFPFLQLHFAGIGSNISAIAFLTLCGIAIALAFIAVCIANRRRNARIVQPNDNLPTMIQKALRAAGGNFDAVMMTADNKQFFGSLAVPTSDGGKILLGWFQLKMPIGRRRSKAEGLVARNEFVKLAKKAARWKIQPEMVDPVKVPENGGLKAGGNVWMYFDEKAVRSAAERKDLEGSKPLIVG
ncbi:hypothetical protein JJE66_26475 [Bradyrhizobium diazoefficiens]|uniref:hypothetical protein n=1 Tax=Bradyrhizobium diazoefficiens TaxID=1355477 RepID=UPI00190A8796|nr:hypothetical protein [Bradyrhizobium diazoefficiens]MBK3664760.1 hypothetical protein [Bradyrhizobium diazoefficiens]